MSTYQVIEAEDRALLEPLLNQRSASDAIITYYALKHPARKVNLFAALGSGGVPTSFLVMAQTGMDLFRPLVIPFVASSEALNQLMDIAIAPDRPFILQMPLEQKDWLDSSFELSHTRTAELLRLDPGVFEPILNVLVLEVNTPDDYSRYEIRSTSGAHAASGVNWVGDEFAEVYVEFDKEAIERKFAVSVLSAMSNKLLEQKHIPLFLREDEGGVTYHSLESVGFRSTGFRLIMADGIKRAAEGAQGNRI
jgi:hypothetical protein